MLLLVYIPEVRVLAGVPRNHFVMDSENQRRHSGILILVFGPYLICAGSPRARKRFGVDMRTPEAMAREVLLLVCSDWAIEPPQPLPPNVKMVGAILTRKADPLPAELEACTWAAFTWTQLSLQASLHVTKWAGISILFLEGLSMLGW